MSARRRYNVVQVLRDQVLRLGFDSLSDDDGMEYEWPYPSSSDSDIPLVPPFHLDNGYDTGDELFESEDEPMRDLFVQINDNLFADTNSTTGSIEDFVSAISNRDYDLDFNEWFNSQEWDSTEDLDSGDEADDEDEFDDD